MDRNRFFPQAFIWSEVALLVLPVLLVSCSISPQQTETQPPTPVVSEPTAALLEPLASPTLEPVLPAATSTAASSRAIGVENAGRVTGLRRLGRGFITATPAYAPDGALLAVPSSTGIDLYAGQSLELVRHLDTGGWVDQIAFSPDGKRLAVDSAANTVAIWNVESGTPESELTLGSEDPYPYLLDLAFSPDGQWLAAAYGPEEVVAVWRMSGGERLFTLKGTRFAFSPDGKWLAASLRTVEGEADRYTVFLYDLADGTLLNQWEGQRAVFSPSGLLALENKGVVRILDIAKDLALPPLEGSQAAFSADGQVAALYNGRQVILYDVAKGAPRAAMEGTYGIVDELRFSPDGQTLAGKVALQDPACCQGGGDSLALWQAEDGKLLHLATPPDASSWSNDETWADYVSWFSFAPGSQSILIAGTQSARLLALDGSVIERLDRYTSMVAGLAFSPDGQSLVAASGSPVYHLRLWDVASGDEIRRFKNLGAFGDINRVDVAFSPDGQILAMGNTFWRVADGSRLEDLENAMLEAYSFAAETLAFAPGGRSLAVGYFDGKLHVWDLEKGTLLRELGSLSGSMNSLAYNPDGSLLAGAYGAPARIVQVWRIPEGQPAFALEGFLFWQALFAPDGGTLATVALEDETALGGFVQLWDAADGRMLHRFETDGATRLAFSPEGQVLAVGLQDGSLRLWRVSDYRLLADLGGHTGSVTGLAFSPDGEILASSSEDGTVILWGVE